MGTSFADLFKKVGSFECVYAGLAAAAVCMCVTGWEALGVERFGWGALC